MALRARTIASRFARQYCTAAAVSPIPSPPADKVSKCPLGHDTHQDFVMGTGPAKMPQEYYKIGDVTMTNIPAMGGIQYQVLNPDAMVKVHEASEGRGTFVSFWPWPVWAKQNEGVISMANQTDPAEWTRMRRALQKNMLTPSADQYYPFLTPIAQEAVRNMKDHSDNVYPYLERIFFEMMTSIVFGGARRNSLTTGTPGNPEDLKFVADSINVVKYAAGLCFSPTGHNAMAYAAATTDEEREKAGASDSDKALWGLFDSSIRSANKYAQKLIQETKAKIAAGESADLSINGVPPYLVSLFAADSLTDEEIAVNVTLFAQVGVDTTSVAFLWCLLHLAENPEQQDLLRAQVKAVMAEEGVTSFQTREQVNKCPLLLHTLKEALRITPLVPGHFRYPAKDVTVYDRQHKTNHVIPAGSQVAWQGIGGLQAEENGMIKCPHQFRLQNWSREEKNEAKEARDAGDDFAAHRFHKMYSPFSFGPGKCPGQRWAEMEICALLSEIVANKRISVPEGQTWELDTQIVIRPSPLPKFIIEDL